jgi:uroporphyrinogen decarboxylase
MKNNERLLLACGRKDVDATPVWLMRQAGRYLPEYRAMRESYSFLAMCRTPDLAVRATLEPIRRFDLDAAIIFSDILLPLEPMGLELQFSDNEGPVIASPLESAAQVSGLRIIDPEEHLAFLMRSIEMACAELAGRIPLIGFCGAPFTLASYAIEGGGSKSFQKTKALMYTQPDVFQLLMKKLTDVAILCLNAQIRHGARVVQVFDSWVGILSPSDYQTHVLPHMTRLFASIDRSAPSIHFGVGTSHLLWLMKGSGCDVLGVDWRLPIDEAWLKIGHECAIQGNLDPAVLFGPRDVVEAETREVLRRIGRAPGHIFNLGHGVLPGTPADSVKLLIDVVHQYRRET